jgi:hypothetical protein
MMTFFTSSMSYHTSERLARALVLLVFAVLIVGFVSTSNREEAEAPNNIVSVAASLRSPLGDDPELILLWSLSKSRSRRNVTE